MHRAFGIVEVVQEIVEHIPRPSLPALALTASLFTQLVQARLWRDISDKSFKSLTTSVVQASGNFEADFKTRSRCRSLATFVHSIKLFSFASRDAEDIQGGLTLLRLPKHPFPFLRKIDLRTSILAGVDAASLLLCPTVESFSLDTHVHFSEASSWEGRLFALLESLEVKAPRISHLEIKTGPDYDGELDEFGLRLAKVLALTCVRLPLVLFSAESIPFAPELFNTLASFPELETLNLYMSYSFNADVDTTLYEDIYQTCEGLRQLRRVAFRGTDVLPEVLRCLNRSRLEAIELELLEWDAYVSDVVEVVCSFARTLTDLQIRAVLDIEGIPEYNSPIYIIPTDVFLLLAKCTDVQNFEFYFPEAPTPLIALHNPALEVLARSWTRLRHLRLDYGWADDTHAPVTLEALIPFSQNCHDLTSLDIHPLAPDLNVQIPPVTEDARPWRSLRIRYPRSLHNLPIPTVAKIAFYLDSIWPSLFLEVGSYGGQVRIATEVMNELFLGLRRERAMRPGTRWSARSQGVSQSLSDNLLSKYSAISDACPWDMV